MIQINMNMKYENMIVSFSPVLERASWADARNKSKEASKGQTSDAAPTSSPQNQ